MSEKFLKGKFAIVTGGSRGIGRATVLMLANAGCSVAFSYLKNKEKAEALQEEVKKLGVKCQATCVDVRNFQAVKEWIEQVKINLGGIDILVNNAGIIIDKALMLMSPDDWQNVIDTHLNGMFNVTRCCIVTFLKQKSGSIVNISSISGLVGLPRQVNYSAAKGGMNAFTKALAKEVSGFGIRVNAVAPGFIDTDIISGFSEKQRAEAIGIIPLARIGQVKDVAGCVRFLVSEESSYITGQIISVDGGMYMRT